MTLPLADVVIPVHNKTTLVLQLMASLRSQIRLGEVVLIDDGSSATEHDVLKTIPNVSLYRNVASEGFVKAVNRGVRKSKSKYILILNSDTEATHTHCLEEMAKNLDDGAAVCGALLLYPKNDAYGRAETIQHCGVFYDSANGFPRHIMSGYPANTPMANVRRRVPAVTGACFMTTREWWDKIGGFDNHFSPGAFEDVSYCIQVNKLNGEVIYEPKAVFFHHEHASQEQGSNWFSRGNIMKNFQYLNMKHGQQPPSDSYWFKGV